MIMRLCVAFQGSDTKGGVSGLDAFSGSLVKFLSLLLLRLGERRL